MNDLNEQPTALRYCSLKLEALCIDNDQFILIRTLGKEIDAILFSQSSVDPAYGFRDTNFNPHPEIKFEPPALPPAVGTL
jgi:hypothetical protein